MGLQLNPPIRTKMVSKDGIVSKEWAQWFRSLKVFDDKISQIVTETYTTDVSLTVRDMGKLIKFNNGANNLVCYLPSVESTDVGSIINIMKLGTGHLRIQAADSDVIGNSSAGGAIVSAEPDRVGANISLFLEAETRWSINAGLGIWYVV